MALPLYDAGQNIIQAFLQGQMLRRQKEQDKLNQEQFARVQSERERAAKEDDKRQAEAQKIQDAQFKAQLDLTKAIKQAEDASRRAREVREFREDSYRYGVTPKLDPSSFLDFPQIRQPDSIQHPVYKDTFVDVRGASPIGTIGEERESREEMKRAALSQGMDIAEMRAALEAQRQATADALAKSKLEAQQDHWRQMYEIASQRNAISANRGAGTPGGYNERQEKIVAGTIRSMAANPVYKEYIQRKSALNFAENLLADKTRKPSGLDDVGLVYAYTKGNDPNRVTEGEIRIAMDNALGDLQKLGLRVQRITKAAPFLTPEARRILVENIRLRTAAAADAFQPQRLKYERHMMRNGIDPEDISIYLEQQEMQETAPGKSSVALPPPPPGFAEAPPQKGKK